MATEECFKAFLISTTGGIVLWQKGESQPSYDHWDSILSNSITSLENEGSLWVKEDGFICMTELEKSEAHRVDRVLVSHLLKWLLQQFRQANLNADFTLRDGWVHDFNKFEREKRREQSSSEMESKAVSKPSAAMSWAAFIQKKISQKVPCRCFESEEELKDYFCTKLESKNVAHLAAQNIVDALVRDLGGKQPFSQQSVNSAFGQIIRQILVPERTRDIFSEISKSVHSMRVYTIAVMGVNGVGKSTSLAKVANYIKKQMKCSVMIAACDTFRSGAVEQLKLHAKRLDTKLYERGYGTEPATVAQSAIRAAKEEGINVVLIDTAGRMQDNQPLMQSLGRLVARCDPDLLLFVGEALVGNDALDQLSKFDHAIEMGTSGRRRVDGILLTKFDTVDDKIGAAITMAFESRKPIFFVGTGQTYEDLRTLEPTDVVAALLS